MAKSFLSFRYLDPKQDNLKFKTVLDFIVKIIVLGIGPCAVPWTYPKYFEQHPAHGKCPMNVHVMGE